MKNLTAVPTLFCLTLACGTMTPGTAAPALWEPNFGSALSALAGQDTATSNTALSFAFPFAGNNYTNAYVAVDGYLNLGTDAHYAYANPIASDLLTSPAPLIAAFFADLDLIQRGSIYFNNLGNRAVFTWDGVGSWAHPETPFSFQAVLYQDGRIGLSYNGVPNPQRNVDTNILVGVGPGVPDPGQTDLSNAQALATPRTAYQLFSAGSQSFDLDGLSLLLTPTSSGFQVTAIPEPSSILLLSLGLAGLAFAAQRRPKS